MENPNLSLRPSLSHKALQSSLAVVAESASTDFTEPSMNVMANTMGLFNFIA